MPTKLWVQPALHNPEFQVGDEGQQAWATSSLKAGYMIAHGRRRSLGPCLAAQAHVDLASKQQRLAPVMLESVVRTASLQVL